MRDLRDFTSREWLELLPLQHAFKQVRDDTRQRLFLNVRPAALDSFLADQGELKNKNVALVVAFEQPWMLSWLIRMARRNLSDATILVFDNSRRPDARIQIEKVCRDSATPYLGLPKNSTRHVNRSHGMAMTWIFHNVVRVIEPRIFNFIDHDLIPVEQVEINSRLGNQPMYGLPNVSKWGWQLWAGYCMYDFQRVREIPLNFLHDFSRGLDTGGRNWLPLYSHYDRSKLRLADLRYVDMVDRTTGSACNLQLVDQSWLHIGGIGYNDNFRRKSDLSQRIAKAFDDGASWAEIQESKALT